MCVRCRVLLGESAARVLMEVALEFAHARSWTVTCGLMWKVAEMTAWSDGKLVVGRIMSSTYRRSPVLSRSTSHTRDVCCLSRALRF